MHYNLLVDDNTVPLEISPVEGKRLAEVRANEKTLLVSYRAVSETRFHLLVDGRAFEAFVVKGDDGKHIFIDGQTFLVRDADRLPSSVNRSTGEELPGDVTPPMPAVVVRVLVAEGDPVEKGQGLVVVSAMKMETTLVAPYEGTVRKINTRSEAKVAPGDILVEIEKEVANDG